MVVGSNQGAAGATGAAGVTKAAETRHRIRRPHPCPGPADPHQRYDTTDPYMLNFRGRYLLYTSEGDFINVPVWIGSRPGRWGPPVDVLPNLPGWAEGGLTRAPDVHKVAGGWALYFTRVAAGVNP